MSFSCVNSFAHMIKHFNSILDGFGTTFISSCHEKELEYFCLQAEGETNVKVKDALER